MARSLVWRVLPALLHAVQGSNSTGTPLCIKARGTGLCLQAIDPHWKYTSVLSMINCGPDDRQLWYFDAGTYNIKSAVDANKCIDGNDMAQGSSVEVRPCDSGNAQSWGYDSSQGTIYLSKSKAEASICLDATDRACNASQPVVWGCNGWPNRNEQHSNPSLKVERRPCWRAHLRVMLPLGACRPCPSLHVPQKSLISTRGQVRVGVLRATGAPSHHHSE